MEELEVDIATNSPNRVVIEGKTSVPFKAFVSLVLQKRVQMLFKTNQNDPVIVSSTLLTALASAPSDKQEDRSKLVLVTFGVGIVAGVFLTVAVFLGLMLVQIQAEVKDLSIILGVILGVAVIGALVQKGQKKSAFTEKLFDAMEKTTDLISR
jgi:hypothetical protein